MNFDELRRKARLAPWSGPGKIPWDDPAFSARMLREHLSQEHGRASRRFEDVDRHVAWIHEVVLHSTPGRVLDLGCGPGLYTARLARLGHACVGIDFSPASIAHARDHALRESLACAYQLRDLRDGDYGSGFDAVLLLSGELNTFSREDGPLLLEGARRALARSGALVLELHPERAVRALAEPGTSQFSAERSVFSDAPHLCLIERRFDEESRTAHERFFVASRDTDDVFVYVSSTRAYSDRELDALLATAGFGHVERHASLAGSLATPDEGLVVLVCRDPKRE